MTRRDKILRQLLGGHADQTLRFEALCTLLRSLGFVERQRGSHRIFYKEGIPEIINVQPRRDGTAKPYQVRQVRDFVMSRGLLSLVREENDDEP